MALAHRVEVLRLRLVEWRVEFCGAYAAGANPSVVTATGPELCAKDTVEVSAERNVQIVILVADAVRGALDCGGRVERPPRSKDCDVRRANFGLNSRVTPRQNREERHV